jgi:hypothetical protein
VTQPDRTRPGGLPHTRTGTVQTTPARPGPAARLLAQGRIRFMDLGLAGRVVLVTGGSLGIGLATVEHLVAEGPWSAPAPAASCGCWRPPPI